ncbi:MAG: type III secretory pathway lipoprotein EscJ [Marinomonas primoryensis]|jgi:type III secretory pathway lipoprotein EscJ
MLPLQKGTYVKSDVDTVVKNTELHYLGKSECPNLKSHKSRPMQSRLKQAKAIDGVPAARVQISLSATVHTKKVNSAPKNSRQL